MKAVQGESPETPLTPLLWEEPQVRLSSHIRSHLEEENVESSAAEPSDAPPVLLGLRSFFYSFHFFSKL